MTSRDDILGRPPIRKRSHRKEHIAFDGPSIAALCAPLSAKVLGRHTLAMSAGTKGAMKQQRLRGRR